MNVLQLENVSYHYAESDKMVLENLSYIFENGKVYSIVISMNTAVSVWV